MIIFISILLASIFNTDNSIHKGHIKGTNDGIYIPLNGRKALIGYKENFRNSHSYDIKYI